MIWKPNVTVAAVIERNGQFLIVEENSADGGPVLNQPAGHLEPNESLEAAIIRETLEETGYDLTPTAIIGSYLWLNEANKTTYLRTTYVGSVTEEPLTTELDDGIIRAIWLTREEIEAESHRLRSPVILQTIDQYLLGNIHPLNIIQSSI